MGPVEVVNISLLEIGAQAAISSFSDGSTEASAAAQLYTPKLQAYHRAAHWNCARFQANLTLLKAAVGTPENPDGTTLSLPPIPWRYEYEYPPDCLKARYLVPFNMNSGAPLVPFTTAPSTMMPNLIKYPPPPFQVSTDLDQSGRPIRVILTDMQQAQLVYTKDYTAMPDMWDPMFLSGATAFLGTWFVNALTRNQALFRDTAAMAKDVIASARTMDGNEGLTSQNREASWISARGAGGAWPVAGYFVGWDAVSFPGGTLF